MTDDGSRTQPQNDIETFVNAKESELGNNTFTCEITPELVKKSILALKRGVSPGLDGISVEHLVHAVCPSLCAILSNLYSIILSTCTVPDTFKIGLLVPILKKATSDPNLPESYRPVSISSIHSKLIEIFLTPDSKISDTQFGFQRGRGTSFVTCMLNDSIQYFNANGSAIYAAALDAEKCFDSIWHLGLFYKLWDKIPPSHWLFLLKWYRSSCLTVKWRNEYSFPFPVTKGMRQGSILSPYLFNLFIDNLLLKLKNVNTGIRIGDFHLNHAVYADDVNLMSTNAKGLQTLINICTSYASEWKFKFGFKKSKCIMFGKCITKNYPKWFVEGKAIDLSEEIDVLGVTFDSKSKFEKHVLNRTQSCRKNIFRLTSVGMSYPGLSTNVKTYLWKSMGSPVLLYGMEAISLTNMCIKSLETCEGTIVKKLMGLNKRSHHSALFNALGIKQSNKIISERSAGLFYRIFQVDTPLLTLQSILLAKYLNNNLVVKGTLIDRLVRSGLDPTIIAFEKPKDKTKPETEDGLVDSLKFLLFHENYAKPWSCEHLLTSLLTKAF
jgi:hypothetical protein